MKKLLLLFTLFLLFQISVAQQMYFPPIDSDDWETIDPDSLDWYTYKIPLLLNFLEETNTKAFLLLKDGKIVIEEYFDDFTKDSIWNWASAAKPITSFLTGIAQEKGLLSIQNPVSDYLGPGWTTAPPEKEQLIKIIHQLTMTCGLKNVGADRCTDPECLEYVEDAGNGWEYFGPSYDLLIKVIEEVSNMDYDTFTKNELCSNIGMDGFWQTTADLYQFFSSTPRSMARFGLLMQNHGIWDNSIILGDREYLDDCRQPSQNMNLAYGYFWWLNGQPSFMIPLDATLGVYPGNLLENAPPDTYLAFGRNQQLLYIVPSWGIVIVRMGEAPNGVPVFLSYMNDLWKKIDSVVPVEESPGSYGSGIEIFPNPARNYLKVDFIDKTPLQYQLKLINSFGQTIMMQENYRKLNVGGLRAGIYFLEVNVGEKVKVERIMIN